MSLVSLVTLTVVLLGNWSGISILQSKGKMVVHRIHALPNLIKESSQINSIQFIQFIQRMQGNSNKRQSINSIQVNQRGFQKGKLPKPLSFIFFQMEPEGGLKKRRAKKTASFLFKTIPELLQLGYLITFLFR